jgi:hypothetical protein
LIDYFFSHSTKGTQTVLPGPDAASPPIEQKSATIWQKHTANTNFNKIQLPFRYFLVFSVPE